MNPEEQLFELLSVKKAEATATNEKEKLPGTRQKLEVYPGDATPRSEDLKLPANDFSKGVLEQARVDRYGVLDQTLADFLGGASKVDQATIKELLPQWAAEYESSSPALKDEALKVASSLMERVKKLTGRI